MIDSMRVACKEYPDDSRRLRDRRVRACRAAAVDRLCASGQTRRDLRQGSRGLDRSDVILIATPHKQYKDLDLRDKRVIDIWDLRGEGRRL